MTSPETLRILSQTMRDPSAMQRLRTSIKTIFVSGNEAQQMRVAIIRDTKSLYVNSRPPPHDWEGRLAISCFEERINTLRKETLLDVYTQVEQLRSAKSAEARRLLAERLLITLSLSYSIDGWFRSKIVQYAIALSQREFRHS